MSFSSVERINVAEFRFGRMQTIPNVLTEGHPVPVLGGENREEVK